MGALPSFREAYGALKDSTKVGLARVNSNFKDLDVAIVKATSHCERPPSDRHVRKIIAVTSVGRPRADVAYCIHTLSRRLAKTSNWIVALKTLIVIHRTLKEGDPTFREEMLSYPQRGHVPQISNFKDDSSQLAWDCSLWVRAYALFLEERLECIRILKYDVDAVRLGPTKGLAKELYRARDLGCEDLLEHLPALQQLLFRLVSCQPEGEASTNYLIQYALALVLKESFKIYCAINDGIIKLVDMFFEMSRHNSIRAFHIYKKAGQLAESLSCFYEGCKDLEVAGNFQFPILKDPPESFLATMEEYIREAPNTGFVSNMTLQYEEKLQLTYKQEDTSLLEIIGSSSKDKKDAAKESKEAAKLASEVSARPIAIGDLLCFDEEDFIASKLEESNAMALAVIPQGEDLKPSVHSHFIEDRADPLGWEVALVTDASSNNGHLTGNKLTTVLDGLLLNSLYGDTARRSSDSRVASNPFDSPVPLNLPNNVAPLHNAQMPSVMASQLPQQQQSMMAMALSPHPYQPHHHCSPFTSSTNPFDD